MPKNRPTRTCMICGRESEAVVCMRCYLNYDFKTYKQTELEVLSNFPDYQILREKEEQSCEENWDMPFSHQSDDGSIEDTYLDEPDYDDDNDDDIDSWFSRLQNFF